MGDPQQLDLVRKRDRHVDLRHPSTVEDGIETTL